MSESQWVFDVDGANFSEQVVQRSMQVPVLVDFWAPWCGPCKTLGPLLEKLAAEMKGAFLLAKVDTDANPELSQMFQIQSIPTVMAIVDGRVADGFMGALPEAEIREFLAKVAPGTASAGQASEHQKALDQEEAGDVEGAVTTLRTFLREEPGHVPARLDLARLLLALDRAADARKVFDNLSEEDRAGDEASSIRAQLELAEGAGDSAALAAAVEKDPDDHDSRIQLGKSLAARGRHEEGLEHLLEAVTRDPHHDGDAARKAMLEIFEALGNEHELTHEFRQRLQVVLY